MTSTTSFYSHSLVIPHSSILALTIRSVQQSRPSESQSECPHRCDANGCHASPALKSKDTDAQTVKQLKTNMMNVWFNGLIQGSNSLFSPAMASYGRGHPLHSQSCWCWARRWEYHNHMLRNMQSTVRSMIYLHTDVFVTNVFVTFILQ